MKPSSDRPNKPQALRLALMIASAAAVGLGIFGIAFGSIWAPTALAFFSGNEFARKFELVIPFLPILLIAAGASLANRSRQ